jgi:hypothetical protein
MSSPFGQIHCLNLVTKNLIALLTQILSQIIFEEKTLKSTLKSRKG